MSNLKKGSTIPNSSSSEMISKNARCFSDLQKLELWETQKVVTCKKKRSEDPVPEIREKKLKFERGGKQNHCSNHYIAEPL